MAVVNDGPSIVACDQAARRLWVLDPERDWAEAGAVRWSWSPDDDPCVDASHRPWFDHLDEALPSRGGGHLLVTASGGAAAAVSTSRGRVDWYGLVGGNPHAIETLPDERVVVASSTGSTLSTFAWPGPVGYTPLLDLCRHALDDAHAVRWDPARETLWALGGRHLQARTAGLGLRAEYVLPCAPCHDAPGGHDLAFIPGSPALLLSAESGVWSFDRDLRTFAPFAPLAFTPHVKSLGTGPRPLYLSATESWWSDTVRTWSDPRWTRRLPGARFYKARWLPRPD